MSSLEKPPIDLPISNPKSGNMTERWQAWMQKLFNRVGGTLGGSAPNDGTYIVQTPNSELSGEQALSLLSSGYLKSTIGSGVVSSTSTIPTTDLSGIILANQLDNTSVIPGDYTINGVAAYTVDAQGRITSSSNPVITITGTTNQIDVAAGTEAAPTISISSTYVGQSSITTLGTITTGTWNGTGIGATFGGTGLTSYSQGEIIYSSAANTLSKLAKNTTSTRYLSNTGVNNNPAWAQIDLSNGVIGDLLYSNLTQGSALSVLGVTGNATADNASIAAGSDHQVLRRSGTSVAFGTVNLASSNAITGTLPVTNGGTGVIVIPSFYAYLSGSQSGIAANGFTKLTLSSEAWDTGGYFDSSTNYRWTPLVAGTYQINAFVYLDGTVVTNTTYGLALYKNGTAYSYYTFTNNTSTGGFVAVQGSGLVQLNGSTDYIEIYVYNGHASTTMTAHGDTTTKQVWASGIWVGP